MTSGLRSAIDFLLTSDSCQVSEPSVKLTECSPDVGVVMDGQGGICTKCGIVFKSKTSLTNHILKCLIGYKIEDNFENKEDDSSDRNNSDENDECCRSSGSGSDSERKSMPRLIVMRK